MPARPSNVPLFATDPALGFVVEPTSQLRQEGYAADQQPPAPHFNWLFNTYGQWIDFLRSASLANFTRASVAQPLLAVAVDDATEETTLPLRRVVALDATGEKRVWVSVRGDSWASKTTEPVATFGEPAAIAWTGARFVVGANDGGVGKLWWTFPDGVGGSSITTPATPWTASTTPGALAEVNAVAAGAGEETCVHTNDAVLYSADGTAFSAATFAAARTGVGSDVCWTGTAWLATTSTGEVWRVVGAASGLWTKVATLAAAAHRLASDGAGNVVAYQYSSSGAPDWYVSTDHGATWAAQTPPAFEGVRRIRFLGGVWVLGSNEAPYLATANDLAATSWLRCPVPYVEGSAHAIEDLAYVDGAYLGVGNAFALVGRRAENTAPAPWTPQPRPPSLHDAAYLRGRRVHDAAPADGDVITWNAAQGRWEPAAPASGGIPDPVTSDIKMDPAVALKGGGVGPFAGAHFNVGRVDGNTVILGDDAASDLPAMVYGYSVSLIADVGDIYLQHGSTVRLRAHAAGGVRFETGVARPRRRVTGAAAATVADHIVGCDTSGGPFTVTLPAANSVDQGFELFVKDETGDAATDPITIAPAGADTIEGAASVAIGTAFGGRLLYSDGASTWFVKASV